MKIMDFINNTDLMSKSEIDKATLLCYYDYKENDHIVFSMVEILTIFSNAGFHSPNSSRLRNKLISNKIMKPAGKQKHLLEFILVKLQQLDAEYCCLWDDCEIILSDSELFDEKKFCGKRSYLTSLIQQINSTYKHHCYDASAVLMRRLFEISLILTYQKLGIDEEIKNPDGTYKLLEGIVSNALNNKKLNLSRIKKKYDDIRKVGNFSAHRIEYIASKKDIDDIKIDYRTALEELFIKAEL